MTRAIVAILALALLLLGGAAAVSDAYESAGQHSEIENESFQPDAGNVTALEHSNLESVFYDHAVRVYGENGQLVDEGADYEWYRGNGTIRTLAGGRLDGDTQADITYGYSTTTDTQTEFASLFANQVEVGKWLIFVLVVALLVGGMRTLGGV